jgi:hypothetical protein
LTSDHRFWQRSALMTAGLFAIVWSIIRASAQSLSLDEADTYFWFASRSANYIFYPFPNNHVLNSLLMWIATRAFGLSSLTVRLPALLGAVLYISTSYVLCRSMINRISLQFPVFVCLVYNPFVLDFMSAARGYSLATAFLLAAISIPVWYDRTEAAKAPARYSALASLALGLSFAANFPFAFVDLAAFLAIVTWAIRRRGTDSLIRVLSCCIFPGLLVVLLLGGYPLTHWPKGELWYGAHSFQETTQSLIDASLYRLDPRFAQSGWYQAVDFLKVFLLPVLAILCLCQLAATIFDGSWLADARARYQARFAIAMAAIVAMTILLHWLAFWFDNLLLPRTRTGIFLIPLCTLVAAGIAASPTRSRVSQWLGTATTTAFICLACYFLLCLRVSYFNEYQYGADIKDVYRVLARLNHAYGVTDVVVHGMYLSPLNFYRVLSKKETFPEFPYVSDTNLPVGKTVYVLNGPYFDAFLKKQNLAVIYRGKSTEVVVAVSPNGLVPPIVIDP